MVRGRQNRQEIDMNVRNTLKTVATTTLLALALGGAAAQADTTVEIQKRPAPGWNDGPHFPGHPGSEYRDDKRQDRVDLRQDDLLERVLSGIESGRLDRKESVFALRDLRDIAKLERAYLADNYLSRFEYDTLDDRLDAAERRLFRDKHDGWAR